MMARQVDPIWWLIIGLLGGTLTFLAYQLSPPKNPAVGYGFAVLLGVGMLVLVAASKLVVQLAAVLRHPLWPYPVRQGMLNLHRPRNQTLLFLLSAGLGVTLILTLFLMQHLLLQFLETKALRDKPNLILIDVKSDQAAPLRQLLTPLASKPLEYSTMVSMQLTQLNGTALVDLQKKPETRVENWILGYRFNSTTRAALTRAEKLITGEMPPSYSGTGTVPVTVDKGLLEKLHAKLGDRVTFAIEEETVECLLVGVREIEWQELGINFFFVFPPGAIEKYPHSGVMTARITDPAHSAAAQKQLATQFPNLNMIDIGQIFATITGIIDKAAFVIRFMALFTIGTGIIILVAVLAGGKRDRVEESVLLRTLGAERAQIWKILVSEYALLGLLASLIGSALALGATGWLAKYAFKLDHPLWLAPCAWAILLMTGFTTLIGLLLSRGITSTPPLAILRGE
jgi:putative ABC transport system permease protein